MGIEIPRDFQQFRLVDDPRQQGRPPPPLWCVARRGSRVKSGDAEWLKIQRNFNDFVYLDTTNGPTLTST